MSSYDADTGSGGFENQVPIYRMYFAIRGSLEIVEPFYENREECPAL